MPVHDVPLELALHGGGNSLVTSLLVSNHTPMARLRNVNWLLVQRGRAELHACMHRLFTNKKNMQHQKTEFRKNSIDNHPVYCCNGTMHIQTSVYNTAVLSFSFHQLLLHKCHITRSLAANGLLFIPVLCLQYFLECVSIKIVTPSHR